MAEWTADAVRAAADAWIWVPPKSTQVLTGDYHLVCFPGYHHTTKASVLWARSDRPAAELVSEIAGYVLAWGLAEAHWTVTSSSRPDGLETELIRRGGQPAETLTVMAWDLAGGLPELSVPDGVRTTMITDADDVAAGARVAMDVWGDGSEPTAADLAQERNLVAEGLRTGREFRVAGYLDGEPASFGGCTLDGPVARLWGAATRARFRGRGAYRAVLAHRMAEARDRGATLALVKARVGTSAPTLRRLGFTGYGEERGYTVPCGVVDEESRV